MGSGHAHILLVQVSGPAVFLSFKRDGHLCPTHRAGLMSSNVFLALTAMSVVDRKPSQLSGSAADNATKVIR